MQYKAEEEYKSIQGIKEAKEAGRDLSPGIMEWSRAWEIREHIIKAPVIERIIYFGIPLVAGLVIHGVAVSAGVPGFATFNWVFALAQLPFIYRFIKKHKGERRMAWAVSAGSFVLPLVYDLTPVYYLAVAIGLHAMINLIVFGINIAFQRQFLNYATRVEELPELPSEEPARKAAVIGIVGKKGVEEKFREKYPDMGFISEKDKDALLERMKKIPGMQPRVLVEMTDAGKIDGAVENAVRIADIQAFTAMYPYLVHPYLSGLREETLRELRKVKSRGRMLEILRNAIPAESRKDVFESVVRAYHAGTALREEPRPLSDVEKRREVEVVEEYIDSFDGYMEAGMGTDPEGEMLNCHKNLNSYLVEYLKNNPKEVISDILVRHRDIAADPEIWRVEDGVVDLIPAQLVVPRAVVIDSRIPGVVLDSMRPAIERYAAKKFYVCIITKAAVSLPDAIKNIDNVIHIAFDPGESMEDTVTMVRKKVADKEKTKDINDVPVAGISMVMLESRKWDVIKYLQRRDRKKEDAPNFTILGEEVLTDDAAGRRMNRLMPTIALLNILKRFLEGNNVPYLITVECSRDTIGTIEKELEDVLYLLEKITRLRIFEELRQFIESLRSIQTAV